MATALLGVSPLPVEAQQVIEPQTQMSTTTVALLVAEKAIENSIDPSTALKVGTAESNLNPKAYNPEWHYDRLGNKICQGSIGIFQIACIHNPENPDALFDPEFNLEVFVKIQKEQGWKPWGVCHDGKVDCPGV